MNFMPEAILKISNVKKVIKGRVIVSDISLEVNAGEIFGFLGPNGAGKTTTIRMITGLSKITEGNIFIDGHSVRTDFRNAIRDVGCIVENPQMYSYMSGLDNLRVIAKLYGNIDSSRINEVVAAVGLQDSIKRKVKTYSLGMKQRLGLAAAMLHKPKLLILDEPTNGLDPAGIKAMRELLRSLAQNNNLAIFVSSHILSEMQQMCDRVGIINNGRMITIKTIDELIGMAQENSNASIIVKTGDNAKAADIIGSLNIESSCEPDGVHASLPKERIPEIVSALAGANIAVYSLETSNSQSLEDVFMNLTQEGK
jgi:ABC-2 type transport system ATP-binding protein